MRTRVSDSYTVILKDKKLPLALLNDNHKVRFLCSASRAVIRVCICKVTMVVIRVCICVVTMVCN